MSPVSTPIPAPSRSKLDTLRQDILGQLGHDILPLWRAWLEARGGQMVRGNDGKLHRSARKTGEGAKAPKPIVVRVPPGSGKTTTGLPSLARAGIPILSLTSTLKLAEMTGNVLTSAGVQTRIHYGRRDPNENEPTNAPGVCVHMDIADVVGSQRHSPMTTACISGCREGIAAGQWIRGEYDDMAEGIEPCGYLLGIDGELAAQALIAAEGAYTRSLTDWDVPGQPLQDRVVVVDDPTTTTRKLAISPTDLSDARQRIRNMDIDDGMKDTIIAHLRDISDAVEATELTIATRTQRIADAAQKICEQIVPNIDRVDVTSMVTAEWEKATVDWAGGKVDAPLRMIFDLYLAGRYNGIMIEKNTTIRAFVPAPWYLDAINGDIFLIIFDATPPESIVKGVEKIGGKIITGESDQRPHVQWVADKAWYRSICASTPADKERIERERTNKQIKLLEHHKKKYGKYPIAFGHKPEMERLAKLGYEVGYWGADHRGTNDFAGRDIIIFGLPIPPPDDIEAEWTEHGMLLTMAGCEDVGAWDDKRTGNHQVEIVPGIEVAWPGKLPASDEQRNWYLRWLAAQLEQALGRTRAADHPDVRVMVVAPPVPLGEHGYTADDIEIIQSPPELGGTHGIWNRVEHREAISRAVAVWQAHPETRESYTATCDILQEHDLPVLGWITWLKIREEYKSANLDEDVEIIEYAAEEAKEYGYDAMFYRFEVAKGMITSAPAMQTLLAAEAVMRVVARADGYIPRDMVLTSAPALAP